MKKVILLGDSIRLGYQDIVKRELEHLAEVSWPEENCMHSIHHLFNLEWYLGQPCDVIHFNFGLWDCRRLGRERPENAVPVGVFVRNLDFLLETIRAGTGANLIWATITPVVQSRYNARFTNVSDPCRVAEDCARYNEASLPVLLRHGLRVNDLHRLVMEQGPETLISEDGIHFTPEGSELLGAKVAEAIKTTFSHSAATPP